MRFDVAEDPTLPQNAVIIVDGDIAVCFVNNETLGPTNKEKLFRLLRIEEAGRRKRHD